MGKSKRGAEGKPGLTVGRFPRLIVELPSKARGARRMGGSSVENLSWNLIPALRESLSQFALALGVQLLSGNVHLRNLTRQPVSIDHGQLLSQFLRGVGLNVKGTGSQHIGLLNIVEVRGTT